jgi:hypothetical protein
VIPVTNGAAPTADGDFDVNKRNGAEKAVEQQAGLDVGRRNLLKLTGMTFAVLGAGPLFSISKSEAQNMSEDWDKVFPRSKNVDHQKITFKNRYGITLAGDLYLPNNRANRRLPALAVGGPFGAVK